MSKLIDLTRQKFGRLTITKWIRKNKLGHSYWLCICDCGKEIIVRGSSFKNGNTKSCGCLQKETAILQMTKHGHCNDETYGTWENIIQRCTNPNYKQWKNYGGRGIIVCDEWLEFPNFLRDNPGWKPGLTIERIDNNKGYYPGNYKWATRKEQSRNIRRNLYAPYNMKNQLLIELCEEHNMPYKLIYDRIYKLGWPPEKAIKTPVKKYKRGKYNKRDKR